MNFQSPTKNDIRSIFSPRANLLVRATDKSYELIAIDVRKGVLTLEKESMGIEELPLPEKQGRENEGHRLLRANAARALGEMGESGISHGGLDDSDVFGKTLMIRVECGHTDGVSLYQTLWHVSEFWVVQFPKDQVSDVYKFKIDHRRILELQPEIRANMPKAIIDKWIDD